jgi:hypothetical protein
LIAKAATTTTEIIIIMCFTFTALLFVGEFYGIGIILAFCWYHLLLYNQSKFECSVDKSSKI